MLYLHCLHFIFLTTLWCRHYNLYAFYKGGDLGTEKKQHNQHLNLSSLTAELVLFTTLWAGNKHGWGKQQIEKCL